MSNSNSIKFGLFMFGALVAPVCHSFGQDHDYVMSGVWNRCESLRTGNCVVQGVGNVEYRFFFDFPRGCIRFETKSGNRLTKFCRNQKHSFAYTPIKAVVKDAPDVTPRVDDHRHWDIRTLGLLSFIDQFERKYRLVDLQRMTAEIWECHSVEETNGLLAVTFQQIAKPDDSQISRVFIIDPSRDFATLEMKISTPYYNEYAQVKSEFDRIGDMWLPTRCEYWRKGEPQGTVTIQWNNINAPIDPATFTPEGMDLPIGTVLVSRLQDGTVVEERIIVPHGESIPGQSSFWTVPRIAVLANATVFALAVVFFLWRRKANVR